MDRTILHSDLNNFYASVECVLNPALRDVPMAVGGDSEKRHGVVLAKNLLAKARGVKTAESKLEAKRKCPELIFVPPHPTLYEEYSRAVKNIYYGFTDRVESFGLDECWLDVTESRRLFGDGETIANRIRNAVKDATSLTVSVGVSFSKTFAKLGSDMKKPDAVTVIGRENYRDLAWQLPVSEMMYVGGRSAEKLKTVNILTIGDLARTDDSVLKALLGLNGLKLKQAARGEHDDEVSLFSQHAAPKSIGHGTTAYRDLTTDAEVRTLLLALSDMVARRLRKYGLNANGVQLSVKDSNFDVFTKQTVLASSTQSAAALGDCAFALFQDNYDLTKRLPVRALSVYAYQLTPGKNSEQLDLFGENDGRSEKLERLEKSIDTIRNRFGTSAVTRAGYLNNQYVLDTFREDGEDGLPFHRG